jgi:RNA polymerase-binding transcription factor
MDKKRLQEFGHRLEARRRELRQSVTQKPQSGRAVDVVVSPDVIDRAASAYDKDFLFRQSTQQKQMLQTVEEAQQRIREGSFGLCLSCGNDITLRRLEAVPWTRYCVACQEKMEQPR